jgi:predicted MFS family arabinose efflux permease
VKQNQIAKIDEALRTVAQLFALFIGYLFFRGFRMDKFGAEKISPNETFRTILQILLTFGIIGIFSALVFSLVTGQKGKPNYSIIVPVLLVLVLLVESFLCGLWDH